MAAVEPASPPVTEPVAVIPEPEIVTPEKIPVIEEKFDFERKEDEVIHEVNRYFVILGSFRISDNANRFRDHLATQGFDPVILLSETGFNRVCVNSYVNEAEARQRVMQIRRAYPQYNDAWLLIRK